MQFFQTVVDEIFEIRNNSCLYLASFWFQQLIEDFLKEVLYLLPFQQFANPATIPTRNPIAWWKYQIFVPSKDPINGKIFLLTLGI